MSDHTNWYCAQCGSSEPGLHYPLCPELKKIVNESKTHAAEVERLKAELKRQHDIIQNEMLSQDSLCPECAIVDDCCPYIKKLHNIDPIGGPQGKSTVDKLKDELSAKDAEIAALTKALKGAVVILEFSGNYNRMTDEDHALCERMFGGTK